MTSERAQRDRNRTFSRSTRLAVKRALDVLVSAVVLVVLLPVGAFVSLAIWLTMGPPILFRQERLGRHGRPFLVLKFRTMTEGFDAQGNPLPDERRLTRFGRLLRVASIDELPQLVNVLRGDMSLVGPRPLLPEYRDRYTAEQWRRHEMKPGLTGPAVIRGRNELPWDERFQWDVWYVDNWSLRLDLRSLVSTVGMVLRRKGISQPGHTTMEPFHGSTNRSSLRAPERSGPGLVGRRRNGGRGRVNVLFTSAGRRVELFRLFKRAYVDLGLSGNIVAVDMDPLAPALQEASHTYVVPSLSDPSFGSVLSEICRRERVDLVFPLIDPDIPVLARYRRELEATGACVVLVPDRSVSVTADKLLTHELFRTLDVPAPRSWLPAEARVQRLDYPVFVKPRFGSAGEQTFPVRDDRELTFFLDYVRDPVVQEFLPGPEITSDVLCDYDGSVLAVVSRRRIEVRWGEVAKGVTVCDPEILRHCVTIGRGLGAIGPITIQCLMKDGTPYFTEVNPRFGGGVPLAIAAGVPYVHWLLMLAVGERPEAPPLGTYSVGLHLSRFDDSFLLTGEERARLESHRV